MRNFLIKIQYDGTNYYGWQSQLNGKTVQEALEKAIRRATGESVTLYGAGRTDSGVHATCQCANFYLQKEICDQNLGKAINTKVPRDIDVYFCQEVDMDFHARFSKHEKTYTYTILNASNVQVLSRLYEWHIRKPLNEEKMNEAAKKLVGIHDFKSFCSIGATVESTVRTIESISVKREDDRIFISVCANGFLYNMVRIIVGTLVKAGLGKMDPCEIEQILNGKDRSLSGITAPAKGLCLTDIKYL